MKKTHFNRSQCYELMDLISKNDLKGCIKYIDNNIKTGASWIKQGNKFKVFLKDVLNNKYDNIQFTILSNSGNSKLSFLSFSTLPITTCPGASECKIYCYSLKAFRYPGAFFRQCQNTILMKYNFDIIAKKLNKYNKIAIKNNTKIDFRLYVDGDFSNLNDLINWMTLLKVSKNINSYGYSKSKHLFLELYNQGFKYPSNYKLNLSNGSKFEFRDDDLLKLDFVRGRFISYKFDKKVDVLLLTKDHKKEIRSNFKNKVFICPGLCDSCTNKGHACGLDTFNNMDIIIPIH